LKEIVLKTLPLRAVAFSLDIVLTDAIILTRHADFPKTLHASG